MKSHHLIFAAHLLMGMSGSIAAPIDEVQALFDKGKLQAVKFSDGSSAWNEQVLGVSKLENGKAIIVRAKYLTLDTDGASKEIRACDKSAQKDTALSDSYGNPIDSNAIPYFVLPWCGKAANIRNCKSSPPYQQLGLKIGDLAAVISKGKMVFAIAADTGPEKNFGEGSVELHRRLGHETVGKNLAMPKCASNESMEAEVFLVIFPKSNNKWLSSEEINKKGLVLWDALRK